MSHPKSVKTRVKTTYEKVFPNFRVRGTNSVDPASILPKVFEAEPRDPSIANFRSGRILNNSGVSTGLLVSRMLKIPHPNILIYL